MTAEEFAEKVKLLNKKLGSKASQKAVADQLSCHSRSLQRWGSGKRAIPSEIADRLRRLVKTHNEETTEESK